ncbi:protein-tyrosine phosphatase family protein [Saccharicrinis aurantiacus]|uniref:protein-tyrosine phosphatase family protein n=1 Tax=Saccharicrinis aurantiacus TaxID=1849719 RepID=UPI000837FF92|nr:dual specificity protein phosphatase family protein [Saccharicrinis aurantiacus]
MSNVLPFEHSYWIIPGKLLAGKYPKTQEELDALLALGIKTFVNLTEEDETQKDGSPNFRYDAHFNSSEAKMYRKPVEDASTPTIETMREIAEIIDGSLVENKPVYFHCVGGVGRTGTVAGSYLMHSKMANADNVFDIIDYLKRTSPFNEKKSPGRDTQRNFVINYK